MRALRSVHDMRSHGTPALCEDGHSGREGAAEASSAGQREPQSGGEGHLPEGAGEELRLVGEDLGVAEAAPGGLGVGREGPQHAHEVFEEAQEVFEDAREVQDGFDGATQDHRGGDGEVRATPDIVERARERWSALRFGIPRIGSRDLWSMELWDQGWLIREHKKSRKRPFKPLHDTTPCGGDELEWRRVDHACEIVEDEWTQSGTWRRREPWIGYTFFERCNPSWIPGPEEAHPRRFK